MRTRFLICFLLLALCVKAEDIPVNPATFATAYEAANDGDVLLMEAGTYASSINIPSGKTITLKAAEEASVIITNEAKGSLTTDDGGIIFDGVEINRNSADYFLSSDFGNVSLIAFRNCVIKNIGRCLIRSGNTGYIISKIEFDNCIITNCGTNGWNLMYPKHIVKSVSVKNSTLYNYTKGESFFFPNASDNTNVFEFIFENNTVYKWALDSNRALCNTGNKYSTGSTYVFRNNIVNEPGVAGQTPKIITTTGGTVTAENNLIVNYGGYAGGTQTINDLSLSGLGMENIGFPDPENGDFTILSDSPLATAGTNNTCIGDPRWIKILAAPVNLTTAVYPVTAGSVAPASAAYEAGEQVTVTATRNYGYKFKEWQVNNVKVSAENPYTFEIAEDVQLTAIFDAIDTYTLTINKEGDGAAWGKVVLNPEPVDGKYEESTLVTITIVPNPVTSFLYWEDQSNSTSRTVLIEADKEITATFDAVPFIVGWDFNTESSARGNRPGDYYSRADNMGLMKLFNNTESDKSSTNWGSGSRSFGGVTYNCARRYTEYQNMDTPRYFQAEFSASGYEQVKYKTITIKSYIAADNNCVHKKQKMQYATSENGTYIDLVTVDLTNEVNTRWVECNATLPQLTDDEKQRIYIRWVADVESGLLGTPSTTETEGFFLANVFVFAELEAEADETAPLLIASIPAEGSATASANGSIVLTFNERVKAGANDGKVTFNGKELTPAFGSKTVTYAYSGLDYGTPYIFTLPEGVIVDMSDNSFEGVTVNFSTMVRPQPIAKVFDAIVAADGTGDYETVQDAINSVPENNASPYLIYIKDGKYTGHLDIPEKKPFVHLIGQSRDGVIISDDRVSGDAPGKENYHVSEGATVVVKSSDCYFENITFENSFGYENQSGPQALAMYTNNDKIVLKNCWLRSYQDTYLTSSKNIADRHYLYDCRLEGAVDYIYGAGDVYFEECTLYNVRSGSVIVAPNHKAGTKWGYVFNNCIVDGNAAAKDGSLKLGRPWQQEPIAVFLNTTMKAVPHPEGWTDMGPAAKLFAEYNSMNENGETIDLSNRRTWYKQSEGQGGQTITGLKAVLTQEEAATYTYENVLSGSDNWNPRAYFESVSKPLNLIVSANAELSWDACDYAICYIVYRDGEAIGFSKTASYKDLSVRVRTEKTYTYSVQPVNEYGSLGTMSDEAVAQIITSIQDEESNNVPKIIVSDNEIIIKNVESGQTISVYSIDGRMVYKAKATADSVYISSYSLKGVYIIKIEDYSLKVIF